MGWVQLLFPGRESDDGKRRAVVREQQHHPHPAGHAFRPRDAPRVSRSGSVSAIVRL